MSETEDNYYRTTKKGDLLLMLAKQDKRIAHPVTFSKIIDDPISSWLFDQLFLFIYAEKINESELLEPSAEQDNSCLSKLFYWQQYGRKVVLRSGVTTAIVYNAIVDHL